MKYLEEDRPHILRIVIVWVSNLLVVAVLAIFLTEVFGEQAVMNGSSMKDTIINGDRVLVDKMSYKVGAPERFDIVLFECADGSRSIKRIIGLPGETVQIMDGDIYIDGEVLECDFISDIQVAGRASDPITLDEDSYFVLGDSPAFSEDSRFENIGDVKRSSIIGKVWFCIYPLKDIGTLQ